MLPICAVVIRVGKNPLEVEFNSKIADESGELVPIPTCPYVDLKKKTLYVIKFL